MAFPPQPAFVVRPLFRISQFAAQPSRSLAISGVLFATALAVVSFLLAMDLHSSAIHSTERDLTSLATVLAEGADRALQAIELVQDAIADDVMDSPLETEADFVRQASTFAIHDKLKTRTAALPQINAVTILDEHGKLLNFSRRWPIPDIDLSDRDYFVALKADPLLKRFVSQPVQNRGDGAWTIYIAHSVTNAKGHFLGLVLGGVEIGYFEKLFARVVPEPDDVLSMFRTDGVMIARYPVRRDTIGHVFAGTGAGKILAADPSGSGATRVISPIDGLDRIIAIQPLAHYPIVLGVGRMAATALMAWHEQAVALGAAVILLVAGLYAVVWAGTRQIRIQRRFVHAEAERAAAAEELARSERQLRQDYARFRAALDNMSQGLCMFDTQSRLVVSNPRYSEIFDVPVGAIRPGMTQESICAMLIARGCYPPSVTLDAIRVSTLEALQLDDGPPITRELADGRVLSIFYRKVESGGWVSTFEDVTERRRAEATIAHMAHHDALTSLPNRLLLLDGTKRLLASPEGRRDGAVLLLDLDGFKQVNDVHGHPFGDELLRRVAARLRGTVGDRGLLARLGGDEFAIVCYGGDQPAGAVALARRVVDAMQSPFKVEGVAVSIGTSIGVALPDTADITPDLLLRNADIALYRAKAAGRGVWCLYEARMEQEIRARRALEEDLAHALEKRQFELHYQPIIAVGGDRATGYEALLRWRHPSRGLVSPAQFIPICEETGLIREIGAWVLVQACADAANWLDDVTVAVNLSPVQFRDGELLAEVECALALSGLPARRLELEITESLLLHDDRANLSILKELNRMGVRIAMDDFGTGYSSLSYLRRFPFDKIKIDQSFVRDLFISDGNIAILRAAIGLGRALGMTVLAEGVETADQRDLLTREGCHELQGYLFGRPKPLNEIERSAEKAVA